MTSLMNVETTSSEQFWTTLGYAAAGSDLHLGYYMSKPLTLLIDLREDPYSEYAQLRQKADLHI